MSLAASLEGRPDAAAMVQRMVSRVRQRVANARRDPSFLSCAALALLCSFFAPLLNAPHAPRPALRPRPDALTTQLTGAAAEASALARTHLEEAAKAAAASGAAPGPEAPPAADADFVDADGGGDELPEAGDGDASAVSPPLLDDPDAASGDFTDRARYIPVRLNGSERKSLRLLEAALSVSEYTDKVDIVSYSKSKVQRINKQLLEICAILCGMVVSCDFKMGQDLIGKKDFKENAVFFQHVFEVGRRHKVMNPEKMRTEYGKLVYLLQDSQLPEVQALLEFRMVKPLKTVYSVLAEAGCLAMLSDPLLSTAVSEIYPDGRQRQLVARDIRAKEQAREKLAAKYAREGRASEEQLLACIYSIADNAAYLRFNRDPVDKCVPPSPLAGPCLHLALRLTRLRRCSNAQDDLVFAALLHAARRWGGPRVQPGHLSWQRRRSAFAPARAAIRVRAAVAHAVARGDARHVPPVVPGRGGFAARKQLVPLGRHGAGPEPRAAGAGRVARHPRAAAPLPGAPGLLGGLIRRAPRRPQRAQRTCVPHKTQKTPRAPT